MSYSESYKGYVISTFCDMWHCDPLRGVSYLEIDQVGESGPLITGDISADTLPYNFISRVKDFYTKESGWILSLHGYKCGTQEEIELAKTDYLHIFPKGTPLAEAMRECLEVHYESLQLNKKPEFLAQLFRKLGINAIWKTRYDEKTDNHLTIIGIDGTFKAGTGYQATEDQLASALNDYICYCDGDYYQVQISKYCDSCQGSKVVDTTGVLYGGFNNPDNEGVLWARKQIDLYLQKLEQGN